MPTWNTLLDLTDLYEDLNCGRKTVAEFGQSIANRLSQNAYAGQLTETIRKFRSAKTTEEIDVALDELWNFGDRDRRIFVKVEEERNPALLN